MSEDKPIFEESLSDLRTQVEEGQRRLREAEQRAVWARRAELEAAAESARLRLEEINRAETNDEMRQSRLFRLAELRRRKDETVLKERKVRLEQLKGQKQAEIEAQVRAALELERLTAEKAALQKKQLQSRNFVDAVDELKAQMSRVDLPQGPSGRGSSKPETLVEPAAIAQFAVEQTQAQLLARVDARRRIAAANFARQRLLGSEARVGELRRRVGAEDPRGPDTSVALDSAGLARLVESATARIESLREELRPANRAEYTRAPFRSDSTQGGESFEIARAALAVIIFRAEGAVDAAEADRRNRATLAARLRARQAELEVQRLEAIDLGALAQLQKDLFEKVSLALVNEAAAEAREAEFRGRVFTATICAESLRASPVEVDSLRRAFEGPLKKVDEFARVFFASEMTSVSTPFPESQSPAKKKSGCSII